MPEWPSSSDTSTGSAATRRRALAWRTCRPATSWARRWFARPRRAEVVGLRLGLGCGPDPAHDQTHLTGVPLDATSAMSAPESCADRHGRAQRQDAREDREQHAAEGELMPHDGAEGDAHQQVVGEVRAVEP
jgi:hypothetical protein